MTALTDGPNSLVRAAGADAPSGNSRLGGLEPGDPTRGQVAWLLRVARVARWRLLASIAARTGALVLGAVLFALPAWAVGAMVVALQRGDAVTGIALLTVAGVAVAAIAKAGLRYLEQLLGHIAAFTLMGELRIWMLDRLSERAPAVTEGAGSARVMTVAHRDIDRVEVVFAHTIAPAATAIIVPPAAVAVAWVAAGPWAALVLAAVLAAGYLVPFLGARAGREAARAVAASRGDIAQQLADDLRNRDELIAFGATGRRLEQLELADERLAASLRSSGVHAGVRQLFTTLRVWGGTVAVLAAGLPAVMASLDALPGVLLSAALVPATAPALDSIERLARSLPSGLEATRRIRSLAAEAPAVPDQATSSARAEGVGSARESAAEPAAPAASRERPASGVALASATFVYPDRSGEGVREVTLEAAPGRVIGVCGASGSGKSTIMRLAQRRRDVDAGAVRLDGRDDVRDLPLAEVWAGVVVVDQQQLVLDASVRENLTLGDDRYADADLERALRCAALDEVVAALPEDIETRLGRRGERLSGGQRQRLTIARALLRAHEGAVLVLDEATSHQDPVTQSRLMAALEGRAGGTIVIAHRLDTLRGADEIVVVDRGRIVERGTWAELEAAGGEFARLLAAGAGSVAAGSVAAEVDAVEPPPVGPGATGASPRNAGPAR